MDGSRMVVPRMLDRDIDGPRWSRTHWHSHTLGTTMWFDCAGQLDYIDHGLSARSPPDNLLEPRTMSGARRRGAVLPILLAVASLASAGCSAPPPDNAAIPADRPAAPAAAGQPQAAAPATAPDIDPDYRPDEKPAPGGRWTDVTIPQGTSIGASLQAGIGSDSSRSGAIVRAVTDVPLRVGELEALPASSVFEGFIGQVIPAVEGAESGGTVALRFRLVRTPVGTAAIVQARVTEVKPAPGGAEGVIVAGDESVADGIAGGTVLAAGEKGRELMLGSGTRLTLVLSNDVPIKVRS
jgi:hypothetical protein